MREKKGEGKVSLSVIVPVYNTARWLGECLDSILTQDAFDLEVICVDDGSTDESPEILKNYAEKDSRVKIITQRNQGVSVARNTGLDAAQGDYVWFFDSDDTINPVSVEAVYQAAVDHGMPQVICFPMTSKFGDEDYLGPRNTKKSSKKQISRLMGTFHTGPETMQILLEEKRNWFWVCMHIIRRDFLVDNGLRFLEILRRHQDVEFMVRVYRDATSVFCIPQMVANHRIREGSTIDKVSRGISPKDVIIKFDYITELYRTYSGSKVLQESTPSYPMWLMQRIQRCQKYYSRMIQDDPGKSKDVAFEEDRGKNRLFDLLIRYPVETGKNLLVLSESEKKLNSRKYRVYSMLPAPIQKIVRKWMGK